MEILEMNNINIVGDHSDAGIGFSGTELVITLMLRHGEGRRQVRVRIIGSLLEEYYFSCPIRSKPLLLLQDGPISISSCCFINAASSFTIRTFFFRTQGKGDKEQQFKLWFDPTADFHTYTILWNPQRIIFTVDGTPIREFKNMESVGTLFPKNRPMRMYSSGLVKTDWSKAPFTASCRGFNEEACVWSNGKSSCPNGSKQGTSGSWLTQQLDSIAQERMRWVQKNYMIYNYCTDSKTFPQGLPKECLAA
ncbi:unnamed protein product [Thlaspi arvense]|uniref:Xyloglucan endotransglucosylase/hydrolase n=1 Tax=Thlaspi arvense TaxID=13288 RepID=A0AAU9SJJ2_THLAR|nr:unnamed protein product [Thlaspi arvense]